MRRMHTRFADTNEIKQMKRQISFSNFIDEQRQIRETTAFPFNHYSCYSFAVFSCYVACVVGDPLIIHTTMHKSCVAWLDFRSHCYTGPFLSLVPCYVARNCLCDQEQNAREPLLFAEKLCIELFTHIMEIEWEEPASHIGLHEKTWFNEMKLVHINRKVNCIFERRTHCVCIGKFCIVRTNATKNQCEDAYRMPLLGKCCVRSQLWCRQFVFYILSMVAILCTVSFGLISFGIWQKLTSFQSMMTFSTKLIGNRLPM